VGDVLPDAGACRSPNVTGMATTLRRGDLLGGVHTMGKKRKEGMAVQRDRFMSGSGGAGASEIRAPTRSSTRWRSSPGKRLQ